MLHLSRQIRAKPGDYDAVLLPGGVMNPAWGPVEAARAIEPLCILWCIPGFLRNEWSHAFKLLKA